MVGLSFAAVPFYSWFCRTTGYGGTPQTATAAPAQISDRTVTVRFDSNVAPGLPWKFEPERRTIDVKLGEVVTVYYTVTNEAARVTAGQAGYNVSPTDHGHLLHQDQLLLLHRTDDEAGRKARDGGRVLCRPQARREFRAGRRSA